jgi:single-stranded-DNA-specific exonuclease
MKNWKVLPAISEEFKSKFPEINPVILQLLVNRGLTTQEAIDEFLNPDYGQDIHDPFLFQQMKKAVDRIFKAVKRKEKIVIYGDYDADGVTASVLLQLTLKKLGLDSVDVYLPHREKEGYGLNERALKDLAKEKYQLMITVDNGISSPKEVKLAKKLGMDVIVTDHHLESTTLPKAIAVIDPKVEAETYPFRYLAGVGVAFKLAQALIKQSQLPNLESFEKWLLDLVAVGTVADAMPLLGENRTLVKYGLVVLNKTPRLGLKALIDKGRLTLGKLNAWNIGFQIGPRLNAAGRMDHANTAYRLLITESLEEANQIAEDLEKTNTARQKLVDDIFQKIKEDYKTLGQKPLIAVAGRDWPVGIIGLVAARLVDKYRRPAVVITSRSDDAKGSARSLSGLNLLALLEKAKSFFSRLGGHAEACGFTLKDKKILDKFLENLSKISQKELTGYDFTTDLMVDKEIKLNQVNWELWEILEKFAPFGSKNFRPRFLTRNLNLDAIQYVGQNGKHLRIYADSRKMIYFGGANNHNPELKIGDKVDIVFEPGINEWNGTRELQLKVIDIKRTENQK